MQKRETSSFGIMPTGTLSCILKKAFTHASGPVSLIFQGGEPTLAGLDFFRQAVAFSAQYNRKKLPVHFSLQTNGIALNEAWAAFLAESHFLVGISLDGPAAIHDKNRCCPDGSRSFQAVLSNIRLLQRFDVQFNILTVVTGDTARNVEEIYRFFKGQGLFYQQYIACLDPLGEAHGRQDYSLSPEEYGVFLKKLFDLWYEDLLQGVPVYNRYFENLVGMLLRHPPESCDMVGHCSAQLVIEADGSVYPCDFYALDRYCIGNLCSDSFDAIAQNRRRADFIEVSKEIHPDCRACRWFPLCRGGCRRTREQPDGALGKSCFCSAYRSFFEYAAPRLEQLAHLAQQP